MRFNQGPGRMRSGYRMAQRQRTRTRGSFRHRTIISSSFLVTLTLGLVLLANVTLNRESFAGSSGRAAACFDGSTNNACTIKTEPETNWETSGYAIETLASVCQPECCNENKNESTGCSGIENNIEINPPAGFNHTALRLNKRLQLENN